MSQPIYQIAEWYIPGAPQECSIQCEQKYWFTATAYRFIKKIKDGICIETFNQEVKASANNPFEPIKKLKEVLQSNNN